MADASFWHLVVALARRAGAGVSHERSRLWTDHPRTAARHFGEVRRAYRAPGARERGAGWFACDVLWIRFPKARFPDVDSAQLWMDLGARRGEVAACVHRYGGDGSAAEAVGRFLEAQAFGTRAATGAAGSGA